MAYLCKTLTVAKTAGIQTLREGYGASIHSIGSCLCLFNDPLFVQDASEETTDEWMIIQDSDTLQPVAESMSRKLVVLVIHDRVLESDESEEIRIRRSGGAERQEVFLKGAEAVLV